jgi:hypothetical protein
MTDENNQLLSIPLYCTTCRKDTKSRDIRLIKSKTKTGSLRLRLASDCVDCDGGKSRFISYSLAEKLDPESRQAISDAEPNRPIDSKGNGLLPLLAALPWMAKGKGIEIESSVKEDVPKVIEATVPEDIPKIVEEVKKKEKPSVVDRIEKYLDFLISHGFQVSYSDSPDSSDTSSEEES